MSKGLGRRPPEDWKHVEKHPLRALVPATFTLEKLFYFPGLGYRPYYDQGNEGACVGFGESITMSYINRRLYAAQWLYEEAKKIDEWEGEDYDGTSLRAGFDVLRNVGHRRVYRGVEEPPLLRHGIRRNEWVTTVDGIRLALYHGIPVTLGINWHASFYRPAKVGTRWWIGRGAQHGWGQIEGGHCITISAGSDKLQAFGLTNSWGTSYPARTWIPYDAVQTLLNQDGEAGVVVDRV